MKNELNYRLEMKMEMKENETYVDEDLNEMELEMNTHLVMELQDECRKPPLEALQKLTR